MGVTDIDDKIINRSLKEKTDFQKLSRFYEQRFFEAMKNLQVRTKTREREKKKKKKKNYSYSLHCTQILGPRSKVETPDAVCRVSEHVDAIIAYIEKIIDKGIGYVSGDSVYFDVKKYGQYGVFHHHKESNEPSEEGAGKRNAHDFALWKKSKREFPFFPFESYTHTRLHFHSQ
jgi:cysteinyl-tRNA synthetase